MERILLHKILNIPAFVWVLQIVYVAAAFGLFTILWFTMHDQVAQLSGRIVFVLVMVAINIVWRVAIEKIKPEWF